MQAYDVKHRRIVNVENEENGVIYAYSLITKYWKPNKRVCFRRG